MTNRKADVEDEGTEPDQTGQGNRLQDLLLTMRFKPAIIRLILICRARMCSVPLLAHPVCSAWLKPVPEVSANRQWRCIDNCLVVTVGCDIAVIRFVKNVISP